MRRIVTLMAVGLVFTATLVAGGNATAAPDAGTCVGVPAGTPQVYVDLDNDGNPEAYLGSVHDPTVCIEIDPSVPTALPQAGLCGTGCVYLKVTLPPVGPNVSGYVSISYGYDGGTYGLSEPFDTGISYTGETICVKIGGTGAC